MSAPEEPVSVGLDFGTTNSLLTYLEPGVGLSPFLPQGSDEFGVPTVIDADQSGSVAERVIGMLALLRSNVTRHFKLGLGKWDGRTDNAKFKASEAFLQKLFEDFKRHAPQGYRNIVVSVPDSWANDREPGGHAIRKIFERLGLPHPRLVSEPIAAACYYAYRRSRDETPFHGHVLIYDHGGGTLDLTLCSIKGDHIETVHSDGMGLDQGTLGFGGAVYDYAVLNHLKDKPQNRSLRDVEKDSNRRNRWLIEFEKQKRNYAPQIKQQISSKRYGDYADRRIFAVGDVEVTLGDLVDVFDMQFMPRINEKLDKFVAACRRRVPTLDMQDPSKFCVVPVGGFSEFYPIQRILEYYFKHPSVSGTATIIDARLKLDERWQAVSKGACVLASETVLLNEFPPFAFGIVSWRGEEKRHTAIIPQNTPLRQLQIPRMLPHAYEVEEFEENDQQRVQFYVERGGTISYAPKMPRPLAETLPEFSRAKAWCFGGSVRSGYVYVEIQAMRDGETFGAPKSIRLGKFFNLSDGTLEAADV